MYSKEKPHFSILLIYVCVNRKLFSKSFAERECSYSLLTSLQRDSWPDDLFHIHVEMQVTIFSKVVRSKIRRKGQVKNEILGFTLKMLEG